jgi:hypothetical protein
MKKMKLKNLIILLAVPCITATAQKYRNENLVQSEKRGWEFEVKTGFRIGGTAPIPLPVEIREIRGYNPTLSIPVEAIATKWLGAERKWGITSGLKLENRGMITNALVKNYHTEIIGDGGETISGHWTGNVKTKIRNTYVTLPVMAAYRMSSRWILRAGAYASVRTEGEFSGYVSDGYLREGDPTGPKIEFSDDRVAAYDFSDEISRFDYGIRLGTSWHAFKHLNTFADLSWGLNSIFKNGFKSITFAMYPIYADFGIGYVF